MTTTLVTFRADQTVLEVMRVLLKRRISGGPVIEGNRKLIGMISEMDCLRAIASGAYDGEPFERGRLVRDLMTKEVITVSPDADLYQMAQLFDQHSIRRLPVVEEGTVIGQVSRRDILSAIEKKY